jgi:hypothetical protein
VLFYTGRLRRPELPSGATLLCYDCHDNNVSADADPANTVFTNPRRTSRSGVRGRFYEMVCGQLPDGNSPPTTGA